MPKVFTEAKEKTPYYLQLVNHSSNAVVLRIVDETGTPVNNGAILDIDEHGQLGRVPNIDQEAAKRVGIKLNERNNTADMSGAIQLNPQDSFKHLKEGWPQIIKERDQLMNLVQKLSAADDQMAVDFKDYIIEANTLIGQILYERRTNP